MDGHEYTADIVHSTEESLEHLRLAAGLDLQTLARKACLSVTQIKQLECGESSSFYSESIRAQASRRVIAILKAVAKPH